MKRLTVLAALAAGFILTPGQDASAGDFLFFHFEDDYSYTAPAVYTHYTQPVVTYEQPAQPSGNILQPVRETAGDVAELYMDLSPAAQIAEGVGLLDRRFVLGLFRGY